MMAAEDGEEFRSIADKGLLRRGMMLDDRDPIAAVDEAVGGSEACRASSENYDGLSVSSCHENRERSQTPAARASR